MCFVEDKGFEDADRIAAEQGHEAVEQKLLGKIQRNGWNAVMVRCTLGYAQRHKLANDIGRSFASIHAALDDVIILIRKANRPRLAEIFVPSLGHGRVFAVDGRLSTVNLYTEHRCREPI